MAYVFIAPYIPEYGSNNTSGKAPLSVEVNGKAVTETYNKAIYWGVPEKTNKYASRL